VAPIGTVVVALLVIVGASSGRKALAFGRLHRTATTTTTASPGSSTAWALTASTTSSPIGVDSLTLASWSRIRTRSTTSTIVATTTTTTTPAPTTAPTTTTAPPTGVRLNAGDIVFDGGIGGSRFEVFVMHPDGTGVRQLTDDPNYNSWWARPSPDRSRILFYRTPAGVAPTSYAQAALWMMNADGSNPHVVLPEGANGWTFQTHAEWSPDGTRIVFTAATTQALVITVAPDGSGLKTIGGGTGANVDPAYSPDGKSIVYVGCPSPTCDPSTTEVYMMPADGSGTRTRLTTNSYRDQDPQISPDGKLVVFLSQTEQPSTANPYGLWNLSTVGIDGTNVHQITSGPALESAPRWSPDGTRIWTHRTTFDQYVWDVTSMGIDGSDIQPINMPYAQEFPAFA
jgi:Tol biopolymer transport system component